jgi:hypothetical protein
MRRIQDARTKALEKHWDAAQELKKAYEEWLRQQLNNLNIPGIIRDLIKPLLPTSSITADLTGSIINITADNGIEDGTLVLSGTFSATDGASTLQPSFAESGTATLKFSLSGSLSGSTPVAKVYSGSIDVTTNSGASWTAIVETDDGNMLRTDPSGSATITVLVRSAVSVKGWGSILPVYPRIELKVHRDSDGVYRVQGVNQPSSAYFNRDPYRITDYDQNGVREFAADFAALSSGLATQNPRADVNGDGLWDAADTDLWLRLFAEDVP